MGGGREHGSHEHGGTKGSPTRGVGGALMLDLGLLGGGFTLLADLVGELLLQAKYRCKTDTVFMCGLR